VVEFGSSAAKYEAKALRVIIKNQDVLRVLTLRRICWRQLYRLPNDENSLRPRARLPAPGKKAKRIGRMTFAGWIKEARVESSIPVMRTPSFHASRYGGLAPPRQDACAGFFYATREVVLSLSFE
jgi:hypothetical protein